MKKQKTTDQQTELEAKVDAMMSVEEPTTAPKLPTTKTKQDEPIDIFAGQPEPIKAPSDGPTDSIGAPTVAKTVKPQAVITAPVVTPQSSVKTDGADDVVVGPLAIDTPGSDEAIADIVALEADQALAAQDAGIQVANDEAETSVIDQPKPKAHPVFWFVMFTVVVIILILAALYVRPDLSFAP